MVSDAGETLGTREEFTPTRNSREVGERNSRFFQQERIE